MKSSLLRALAIVSLSSLSVLGAEPDAPIRALLVTGGCCHDYARQKLILTQGISARANVNWTIVHQGGSTTDTKIPLYEDPNWSEGFDIVVHNECFAHVSDIEWVENVLKPHREGLPAILIHCAMHCYRTGDDRWFEFVGMQSPGHGAHYPYKIERLKKDHFIMERFGDDWTVPKGELYHSMKVWPSATPLAAAKRKSDNQPQVCVWTNQYRQGRVFGTTIGHYNETMADPRYLDMVTRGLLWAVKRTDATDFRATDEATNEKIRQLVDAPVDQGGKTIATPASQPCCGAGNLAYGQAAAASSEESHKKNFVAHAIDGNLATRWCAANSGQDHWWQVDLQEPRDVKSLRIHWEMSNAAYRYRIQSSVDGKQWENLVDASENKKVGQINSHDVDAKGVRLLRVHFLGSNTGAWGSIREFEAYPGPLPELPKELKAASDGGTVATIRDVQAPSEFNVTLFGTPPEVNYPVCLTAAPTGEVFVGVDEQGSLGKQPGGGRVLRCIDADGDGRAERVNVFAKMDHPRGLIYDTGTLWVLHPPFLSVYHDDDLDGVADRSEVLIEGISTDQVNKRGADHTTNGIRMGIDGWIYIAVGDFGFTHAKAKDGAVLSRRGGGIVRIRPDGADMEIYCWGLRNILDVCIDPHMNIFTRDNTNDGGGWNVRLSHIFQSAQYGYPSLYKNFSDEIMPTLKDYGGGSGCGGMYLHDARWPAPYSDALYTCDWGRSEVYRHNLPATGATFAAHQELFAKIPRPTDIDVDGSGRMYISSWKDGSFDYKGPNVGFVAQLTPKDFLPKPFPHLKAATLSQLLEMLTAPSAAHRLHSQREILRRGADDGVSDSLQQLAADDDAPLFGRVAAIYTLKQLDGELATSRLVQLADSKEVREFAIRALTDRLGEMKSVPTALLAAGLEDANPRVVAQSAIALGRLGQVFAEKTQQAAAAKLLTLATPPPRGNHTEPNPSAVIPHLARQASVSMKAVAPSLKALADGDPKATAGALWTLRSLHDPAAVTGLIKQLNVTRNLSDRLAILTTLIRLHHQEAKYEQGWWGTRPDTTGPYFDRQTWGQSDRIATVVRTAIESAPKDIAEAAIAELARHKVRIDGLPSLENLATPEKQAPIVIPPADPANPNQVGNMDLELAMRKAIDATSADVQRGRELFTRQSCVACHTVADGQSPKGPHLVDIGKRYKRHELIESLLKPSAKIAQGFDTYSFVTDDGEVLTGFVVSESADAVTLRQADGIMKSLPLESIERRRKQEVSMMPKGIVNNLTVEQLSDLIAYLNSLTP